MSKSVSTSTQCKQSFRSRDQVEMSQINSCDTKDENMTSCATKKALHDKITSKQK